MSKNGKETVYGVIEPTRLILVGSQSEYNPLPFTVCCLFVWQKEQVSQKKKVAFGGISQSLHLVPFSKSGSTKKCFWNTLLSLHPSSPSAFIPPRGHVSLAAYPQFWKERGAGSDVHNLDCKYRVPCYMAIFHFYFRLENEDWKFRLSYFAIVNTSKIGWKGRQLGGKLCLNCSWNTEVGKWMKGDFFKHALKNPRPFLAVSGMSALKGKLHVSPVYFKS